MNTGIGPAIIQEVDVTARFRDEAGTEEILEGWSNIFSAAKLLLAGSHQITLPANGDGIGVGEKMVLLTFDDSAGIRRSRDYLLSFFAAIDIVITYESMYGKRFTVKLRDDDKDHAACERMQPREAKVKEQVEVRPADSSED